MRKVEHSKFEQAEKQLKKRLHLRTEPARAALSTENESAGRGSGNAAGKIAMSISHQIISHLSIQLSPGDYINGDEMFWLGEQNRRTAGQAGEGSKALEKAEN